MSEVQTLYICECILVAPSERTIAHIGFMVLIVATVVAALQWLAVI